MIISRVDGIEMQNRRHSIHLAGLRPPGDSFAKGYFTSRGYTVTTSQDPLQAGNEADRAKADVIYLQASSDAQAALEVGRIRSLDPSRPVVAVAEKAATETAVTLFRSGAADVLFLPLTAAALDGSLDQATRKIPAAVETTQSTVDARVHFLDESGKERWITIIPPRFTIGRSSNNDLVLSNMSISRSHAEIYLKDSVFHVRDMGSKHGTFVNGSRIEEVALTSGDRVQLGGPQGQSITFHSGDLLDSLLGRSETKPEVNLPVRGFREFGMLLETFRALSSIPLVDDLLALVVDTAIELTGAERGFIMLRENEGALVFRCARNDAKRALDGNSFQTSRRVPEEVFSTGKSVVINDLDFGDETEDHSSTRRLGLRSIFCVPLRYHTFREVASVSGIGRMETIGVLYVDSQSIGTGLSNTQIDALETLASEAAMAIYNARLYRDSQEKRKLEEELAIAREIQQALLPQPHKETGFVRACSQNLPCREVGGDYFDYFDLEDGRIGFALGDVAGKGMPAALLTSMLQGIFSAQTLLNLPLPSIISNVNKSLVRRGTGNRFVTFFFGILDVDGTCTYTNAGHNPPYVLRRDGTMTELTEGGMVLGLFGSAQYESRTVALEPGDQIVLFTDGVVEARNTAGDEFGEERLRALLRESAGMTSEKIVERIHDAVMGFADKTPQHDDITMMVVSYSGRPS